LINLKTIAQLPSIIDRQSDEFKQLFHRFFSLILSNGRLTVPTPMVSWVNERFGSIDAVINQKVLKITNKITLEGTIYNTIRDIRPTDLENRELEAIMKRIEDKEKCLFCNPIDFTSADVFGRIRGNHCLTASNVAKFDGYHGLVIFDEHNPLKAIKKEAIADYLDTAMKWAIEIQKTDPEAKYFFSMWNCLWKAAASVIHGHMQMTMTKGLHYGRVEALRRAAESYSHTYQADYFADLVHLHEKLDLVINLNNTKMLAYLTPIKQNEILLLSEKMDKDFKEAIYTVLDTLVNRMNVKSFNMAIYHPPLAETEENWSNFPMIARIVDRGDIQNWSSGVGSMELYASSVIGSDPFLLIKNIKDNCDNCSCCW
jgi:hypothetical protein